MKYTQFHELRFRNSVATAMKHIETILDVSNGSGRSAPLSNSQYPKIIQADTAHTYDDKFTLAELVTNTSIATQMNALERLGLDSSKLAQILSWTQKEYPNKPIMMRFQAEDTCSYLMEQEVDMNTGITAEHEIEKKTTTSSSNDATSSSFFSGLVGGSTSAPAPTNANNTTTKTETVRTKVITKVKEYHWKVSVNYRLIIFVGGVSDKTKSTAYTTTTAASPPPMIELQKRSTETTIITPAGTGSAGSALAKATIVSPIPERTIHTPIDVKLNWLFQQMETSDPTEPSCQFRIQRGNDTKRITPRRNDDVKGAELYHKRLYEWARNVHGFLIQRIEKDICSKHNPVPRINAVTTTSTTRTSIGGTGGTPNPSPIILEPGMIGVMFGLQKEPTFNGKRVRILEYNKDTRRYKAEPADQNSNLPSILSIKPGNVNPDVADVGGTFDSTGSVLSTISDDSIFCPVLPLMEGSSSNSTTGDDSGTVAVFSDVTELLNEQTRTIDEMIDQKFSKLYPPKHVIKLISISEAIICLLCQHIDTITTQYADSIDFLEFLMKEQLVAAIGKELSAHDFEQFMTFQYTKLFALPYQPKDFTYAIRRPGFYPDGIISIESSGNSTSAMANPGRLVSPSSWGSTDVVGAPSSEPIQTFHRKVDGTTSPSIYIPINSATTIEITGDRYIHGWMQHRYLQTVDKAISSPRSSGDEKFLPAPDYNIVCRARQFSCFLLVLGTLRGPTVFEPKDAIIVKDKDEILIPLMSNILPSAKEFRDMISSLSPTQQEFAKAYRAMQLESSVFGLCIIQIKPQLERLLNLHDCSLTKEIQLTQDLISLFIDFQIPSDIVSYDDNNNNSGNASVAGASEKLEAVRGYVKAVMGVIDGTKQKQLKDEELKADMRSELQYKGSHDEESGMNAEYEMMGETSEGKSSVRYGIGRRRLMNKKGGAPVLESSAPFEMMSAVAFAAPAAPPMRTPQAVTPPAMTTGRRMSKGSTHKSASARNLKTSSLSNTAVDRRQQHPQQASKQPQQASSEHIQVTSAGGKVGSGEDFTMLPKLLDATIDQHDTDGSLCSTVLKSGTTWTRTRQENLLVQPVTNTLTTNEIDTERKKAYDLLDAISRSGTLPIACSELHVIVAVSHCFENDIMGSVIQDDVNPIEKVERSSIILASAICCNGSDGADLISNDVDRNRLRTTFPALLSPLNSTNAPRLS